MKQVTSYLLVLDDLHMKRALVKHSLDCMRANPEIVGVEVGKLGHTLEVLNLENACILAFNESLVICVL